MRGVMQQMIVHYSFDFDYTLADSSTGAILCINYALEKLGYPTQLDADIQKTIGLSLQKSFETLVPGEKEMDIDSLTRLFKEKADEVMLNNIIFYNEVAETLSNLKARGNYISIVSTKYKYRIEAALKRDNLFYLVDNIVGGECVVKVKPNPEGLNKAIHISGVPVNNTIYIGDSLSDGECASRANVRFIAVTTGVTKHHLFEKWKPIKVIKCISALAENVA